MNLKKILDSLIKDNVILAVDEDDAIQQFTAQGFDNVEVEETGEVCPKTGKKEFRLISDTCGGKKRKKRKDLKKVKDSEEWVKTKELIDKFCTDKESVRISENGHDIELKYIERPNGWNSIRMFVDGEPEVSVSDVSEDLDFGKFKASAESFLNKVSSKKDVAESSSDKYYYYDTFDNVAHKNLDLESLVDLVKEQLNPGSSLYKRVENNPQEIFKIEWDLIGGDFEGIHYGSMDEWAEVSEYAEISEDNGWDID